MDNGAALEKFGKNWKQVEEYIGTRTGAQIRSHAQKYFNKINKEQPTLKADRSLSQGAPDSKCLPDIVPNVAELKVDMPPPPQEPAQISPILQEYTTELSQHRELLDSARRILSGLKSSDPLFAVKLTQGEELLKKLHAWALELYQKLGRAKDLREACSRHLSSINEVFVLIKEISPDLKDVKYSGYLCKIMYHS